MPGFRGSWGWFALVDGCLLVGSLALAVQLRFDGTLPVENRTSLLIVAPILIVALPIVFFGFGLYIRRKITVLIRSAIFAEVLLLLLSLAAAFWFRGFALPRSVIILTFVFHLAGALTWRMLLLIFRNGKPLRVMVSASDAEAIRIVEKILNEPPGWYEILSVTRPAALIAGGTEAFKEIDVLVAGPSVSGQERQSLLRLALQVNVHVYLLPDLDDILMGGAVTNQIDDAPVLQVRPLGLDTTQRIAKRCFDLGVSIPLLLITAPFMAFVWLGIRLLSPGPALFSQTRVGLDGKEFTLYKFRTMVLDAERQTGPILAVANDSRVTPFGQFLRATRLDELPQLWNVLRGDMSLVGPRPERPFFVDQFTQEMPDYPLRHVVPPGVTGLAQVMGKYHTSVQDKLRFDLYYLRHYSVLVDFKILLLTLQAVISRDSSAGVGASGTAVSLKAQEMVLGRSVRM